MMHSVSSVFYIGLNSHNASGTYDIHSDNVDIMNSMNKNMLYYYFCIDIHDYIFHKIDSKNTVSYAVVPKYLCIKTYYPSLDFYESVMHDIEEYIIQQRISVCRSDRQITDDTLNTLSNMRYEFEDGRIYNNNNIVSAIVSTLHTTLIDSHLPTHVRVDSINRQYTVPVDSCHRDTR